MNVNRLILVVVSIFIAVILLAGFLYLQSEITGLQNTGHPTSTPVPAATANPSAALSTNFANIEISYEYQTAQNISVGPSGAYMFGRVFYPDSGNKFLEVNMTVENNGYVSGFDTNASYFSVLAKSVECFFNASCSNLLGWGVYTATTTSYSSNGSPIISIEINYVDILNGGDFNGTLVFQVPKSATTFVMNYQNPSNSFNIIWIKS